MSKPDKDKGLVFNIQRFSIHDGPGIRTTVFFKGCPLACQWCSNPESISSSIEIMTYDVKCIKCGHCIEVCHEKAISIVDDMRSIDRSRCNLCLECVKICPSGAIEQAGKYFNVEDLVEEIEKDRIFFNNSGGGVTFSGGEPLSQWRFLVEVLKSCKERGLHTALDTTGYAAWDIFEQVLDYTDLVLYDLKHFDTDIHRKYTGVKNDIILKNIAQTVEKKKTWIRVPVIPRFNDNEEYMRMLIELILKLNNRNIEKVSLLPYHSWGEQKYERLGQLYPYKDIEPLEEDKLAGFEEMIQSVNLEVTLSR